MNKPSFLEYKGRRFLIIDAPTDRNVQQYIKEFKKYNVTNLVRACSPSYDTAAVVSEGVSVHVSMGCDVLAPGTVVCPCPRVHAADVSAALVDCRRARRGGCGMMSPTEQEMAFQDGSPPPRDILERWLTLCDKVFKKKSDGESKTAPTVAVHCVAGLGRAPVLVAVALIEAGLQPLEAVDYVRKHRCVGYGLAFCVWHGVVRRRGRAR